MKKLFTLLSAVMLVFALGANAQSRKTWDFTKGVSDATRAALDADAANWTVESSNTDGSTARWKNAVAVSGELKANGEVVSEFSGLTCDGAANAFMYFGTKVRMTAASKVTLPSLTAGQKIAISAQSANTTATNRGFVFTNATVDGAAADANGKIILLGRDVQDSPGVYNFTLTVAADGVVVIETGTSEAAAGVEINSIIIDEGDKNIKKWDFTNWSEATKTQVTTAADWTTAESASKNYITGDEIRWLLTPTLDANEDLTAAGSAIAELKGLRHTGLNTYSYGIAFDYQNLLDGNQNSGWGPYYGPSYLWVMGVATTLTVPNVKAGSTFKIGVETHKYLPAGTSDARGFQVFVNGVEIGTTQKVTAYQECEYTIPTGEDEFVDVVLTATKGCHLYFIEAEVKDENYVDKNPKLGAPSISLKNGVKVNPNTFKNFTVKFPKAANLAEETKVILAGYCGPAVIEDGDDASNYMFDGIEGNVWTGIEFDITNGFALQENTNYEFYLTSIVVDGFDALNVEAADGEKLYPVSFATTGPGIPEPREWNFTTDVAIAEAIAKSINDGLGLWNAGTKGRYSVSTNMFNNGNQQLLIAADTPLLITKGLLFTMSTNNDILVGTPAHNGATPDTSKGGNNGYMQLGGGSPSLIIPQCNAGDEITIKALYANKEKGGITIVNGTYNGATTIQTDGSATDYKIIVTDNGDVELKSNLVKYATISIFPSTIEKKEINYTVNAVDGEGNIIKAAVKTGTAQTNDNISVPYSYWITDADGAVYTKGTKGTPFSESFVIENDKTDYNLVYKSTAYGKAVYCEEAENIEGTVACTHANAVIRSSGTKAAYNDKDITLVTLAPGSYKIKAVLFDANGTASYNAKFTLGTQEIDLYADATNWAECESELLTVTEATPLVWTVTEAGENKGLDIILVYESEDVPDDPSSVNGVAENGNAAVKTVKFVKNGKVIIEGAKGTYTAAGAQVK